MEELTFQILIVVLVVGMKIARWRGRRWLGWNSSWDAAKKNPIDGAVSAVCHVLWTVAIAVYVLQPDWLSFARLDMPIWLRWVGFGVGVSGVLVVGWADRYLGSNLSAIVQIKEEQTLITGGPYRWVRHPIYTGGLLFCCGHFLVSANWFVGACCVGGAILLYVSRIPREEKMMRGKFGDEYCRYSRHTGRLLPRILSRT